MYLFILWNGFMKNVRCKNKVINMINISSQEKISSDLTNYIISKITGTHVDDEIVDEKPRRLYLIGTLAARKKQLIEDSVIDDGKAASIRASKLKVSILTQKSELTANSEVVLNATGNVYYIIKSAVNLENSINENEDVNSKKKKNNWKRIPFSEKFKLNISRNSELKLDFSRVKEKVNSDPTRYRDVPDGLWSAKISVTLTEFGNDNVLISFNYENDSREPEQLDNFERTLFNSKLEIDVGNITIQEFVDDYQYEGHKQRYFYDFRTVNCQVRWQDDNRKHISTEHFARFEQQNIRPRDSIPDINSAILAEIINACS